jgi:phosphoglycerol transferase MdoB-like AlkP superfamily enzyme
MAIIALICGILGLIIGLLNPIICAPTILDGMQNLNLLEYLYNGGVRISIYDNDIPSVLLLLRPFLIMGFISLFLIVLALVFGMKERKKGKEYNYYNVANTGFILGLIGILLEIILPLIIFFIGNNNWWRF